MADERKNIGGGRGRRLQKRKPRKDGWTAARRQIFLDHLASSGNVTASAEAAGIKERSAYGLRLRDAEFAAKWQSALAAGYVRLEGLLIERAGGAAYVPGGEVPAADASTLNTDLALQLLRQHRSAAKGLERPRGIQPSKADKQELNEAILRLLELLNRRLRKRRETC